MLEGLGKLLLTTGIGIALLGLLLLLAGRAGLPQGRLPGDLAWRGRYGAVFVPLGTSLLLSVLLSLGLWLLHLFRR